MENGKLFIAPSLTSDLWPLPSVLKTVFCTDSDYFEHYFESGIRRLENETRSPLFRVFLPTSKSHSNLKES